MITAHFAVYWSIALILKAVALKEEALYGWANNASAIELAVVAQSYNTPPLPFFYFHEHTINRIL